MKKSSLALTGIVLIVLMIVSQACDKKENEEQAVVDIEFSYTPNPATVNTAISFDFEAVEAGAAHGDHGDDHHFELSMVTCEVGSHDGGTHQEMTITHNEVEDHYEGTWTFIEAGTYEIHFGYMYENEMFEKEFEIVVIDN